MKFAAKVAVTVAIASTWMNIAGAATTTPDINERISTLQRAVTRAQAGGRLTSEEADNFKSALAQVGEDEAQTLATVGNMGPLTQARLLSSLAHIEKKLYSSQHDRLVAIFDFGAAQEDLRNAVETARADGRLSAERADAALGELKSITEMQQHLLRDGIISYGDALVVSFHIDAVTDILGKRLADQSANTVANAEEVANAASAAISKLSGDQAAALRKQFDEFQQQLNNARVLKGQQAAAQNLFLASQFELLKAKADMIASGKTEPFSIRDRIHEIDFAIGDAFTSGKLTPAEAHELRAELQGSITEMGSGSTIAPEKAARIALELERLAGEADRWEHTPQRTWAGFDAYQTAFDQRITEAAKANRITADQLAQFKSQADAIAKAEAAKRATNSGKLTATDALDLAIQMEKLAVALHHEEKDRALNLPDVDALQAELNKLIIEGIATGQLAADGSLLTERLAHLSDLRANYEKVPGGLDVRARLALADSIQHMIAQTQLEMHRDVPANLPLDLRLDHLGDVVSNAVASGLITIDRGAQYRSAVDTIYSELAADRKSPSGLTAQQTIAIANDIDLLQAQITDELREAAMPAPVIAQGIDDARNQIARAIANGRLTLLQGNDLIAQLDRTSAALNQAASAEGGLSHGEGLKFAFDVQHVRANFANALHDNAVPVADVAQQALALDTRLANALASGQLSVTQAQQFRNDLDQVIGTSRIYRQSGGGLSLPETIAVAIELEQVAKNVETTIGTENMANRNVDSREADLKQRIRALVGSGKLSQKDADTLAYDLDRIEESEAAFRISDEGLNYAEALTLTLDLDRLSTKIDTMSKGSVSTLQQPRSR